MLCLSYFRGTTTFPSYFCFLYTIVCQSSHLWHRQRPHWHTIFLVFCSILILLLAFHDHSLFRFVRNVPLALLSTGYSCPSSSYNTERPPNRTDLPRPFPLFGPDFPDLNEALVAGPELLLLYDDLPLLGQLRAKWPRTPQW